MSEIKWIKITTDIFDDEKILLIESMPDADALIVIWLKLLILAGKKNAGGWIFITEKIAFNEEAIATIIRRPLNTVRLALDTFVKFGMVEILPERGLFISNWEKHQNIDGMDRVRQLAAARNREYRARQKDANNQLSMPYLTDGLTNTRKNEPTDVSVTSRDGTDKIRIDKIREEQEKRREEESLLLSEKNNFNFLIFETYEEEIGILTAVIKDEIYEAIEEFSGQNVIDAIKEAAKAEKREWRYVMGILKNWQNNGHKEKKDLKNDPDKFVKGRYGDNVLR